MSGRANGSTDNIRKQIRIELFKMSLVMAGLAAVAVFARDFVLTGLMAKLALNGTIWAVFFFGCWSAFRTVFRLKNDELAFAALVEAYDDFKQNETREAEDPYWRHYKCLQPANVYQRPHILGHFYELVFEELLRTRKLRVSVATMQNLVHGVEQRLAEERSLVLYLSGLLVFLGLIGAFIGLLQMVASVGGIVGSLGAGGTGPEAFTKLIGELQGPLKGMSVGFSSSLFGLAGSLALGLMARLSNHAATVLKVEFEGWLANVARIEDDADEDEGGRRVVLTGGGASGTVVVAESNGSKIANRAIEAMAKSMAKSLEQLENMAAAQREQGQLLARAVAGLESMAERQADLPEQLSRIARQDGLSGDVARLAEVIEKRMVDGFTEVGHRIEAAVHGQGQAFAQLAGQQAELLEGMAVVAKVSPVTEELRRVGRSLENGMQRGFEDVGKLFEGSAREQLDRVSRIADHQSTISDYLVRVSETLAADRTGLAEGLRQDVSAALSEIARGTEKANLRLAEVLATARRDADPQIFVEMAQQMRGLEGALRDGLVDLSRGMERAFVAYAQLAQSGAVVPPVARPPEPEAVEPEPEETEVKVIDGTHPETFVDHEEMMRRLYSAARTLKSGSAA